MTSTPALDLFDATPAPEETVAPRPGRRLWLYALFGLLATPPLLLLGAALYVLSCLTLSSTTADLKNAVVRNSGGGWESRFTGRVGWLPLAAARCVVPFIPQAPPEAHLALQAARGGEVAVYQRPHAAGPADYRQLLLSADKVMARDGWERAVGVMQGDDCVGVYVPRDASSPSRAQVCVFVVSGNDLVIASARANLNPLLEIVRNKLAEEGNPRLAGLFR